MMILVALFTLTLCPINALSEYELSGNFEGDIVLSPWQEQAIQGIARNGLISEDFRWPYGIVPYRIATDDFTGQQIDYIRHAMDEIEKISCVSFVEADDDETEFVQIIGTKPGCTSSVGNRRKKQYINFQPNHLEEGCFRLVALMHELMHTLGFFHMQSAPERDDYLIIMWNNIKEGQKHNFKKFNSSAVTGFSVEYDYDSIMHYPAVAFSKNGEPTMIPLDDNIELGRHHRLSKGDITRINRMYRCEENR